MWALSLFLLFFFKITILRFPCSIAWAHRGATSKLKIYWPWPTLSLQDRACFLCCPSLPWPTASIQSQRDLQRHQLTFLLLAFSRTSVTLLLGFWMSSKAGSFCLRTGRGEIHPLRCAFASGCWPPRRRVLFLWRGQAVDGPSVLCKQEIKSRASAA